MAACRTIDVPRSETRPVRGQLHIDRSQEGKPGGKGGCDYIFRYTRSELAALFPSARIRAVGFYNWPAQMLITKTAGHTLARRGHGHMILAYGAARKFSQTNLRVSIAKRSRGSFRGR